MNNMSVEKKEMDEPLEEKRKKFDSAIWWYAWLDDGSKKAFDSLKFPRNENKDETPQKQIHTAIDNTVQNGIKQANLSEEDQKKAEEIQWEMMKNLENKSPKEMIQEYAKFRTELIAVLSTDSAKDETGKKQWEQSQQQEQKNNKEKLDFSEKVARTIEQSAQDLGELLKRKVKKSIEASEQARSKGTKESKESQQSAFLALSKWPK